MNKLFFIIIVSLSFTVTGCRKKCNDPDALNETAVLFGSTDNCEFSKIAFYANQQVASFTVTLDGENLGTSGVFYPGGPGNCSATGTLPFRFRSGEALDWNATIVTMNGFIVYTNGTIEPSPFDECIVVNVTI